MGGVSMRLNFLIPGLAVLLAACGGAETEQATAVSEDLQTFDATEAPPAPDGRPADAPAAAEQASAEPGEVPVSLPRIAYTYGYTFRLPAEEIGAVQERHLELCRQLGPQRCRVVNLQRSAASGDYATAATTLQVAAPIASQFGQRLVAAATEQGADMVERAITGEDLSRQMVDTEARIRTRETLIRRLTELLETRSGNIEQAVEAERAINNAQEELEAARGWLAEMRTRVSMSTFNVNYQSGAPLAGGVGEPIRDAFAEVGAIFARSLGALILLIGVLLPWLLVGLGLFFAIRAIRRRGWIGRRHKDEDPPAV